MTKLVVVAYRKSASHKNRNTVLVEVIRVESLLFAHTHHSCYMGSRSVAPVLVNNI